MAARAFQLNPNPASPSIRMLRSALVLAGRYEEALEIHQQMPRSKYIDEDYIDGAILMASLARMDEAHALVADARTAYPDLTIESWTGTDDWGQEDRRTYVDLMNKAGFPPCASAADIGKYRIAARLPECVRS